MFADGSRLDDRAAGYAAVWKNGQSWVGVNTHMGYNQEAYDAECAAPARALESGSRRQTTPEWVTIFTDAQATIGRMASEEPGRDQKHALQTRKHIAVLRKARLDIASAQGSPREREGRRMGQARSRGARCPRGGMAEFCGPAGGGMLGAAPQIPRAPQAGDHREETGRGPTVGWRPDLQEKAQDAKEPEAGRHGGWEYQEARLEALPDEEMPLPHRAVSPVDEEPAYRSVLVVPVPDSDSRSPFQGVPRVGCRAEGLVGGGAETNWEVEESVEDPRLSGRWAVRSGGIGFPLCY